MMAASVDPILTRLRLCIITVLLVVLGVAIVAEFTRDIPYNDHSARVRDFEVEEHSTDQDLSAIPVQHVIEAMPARAFILPMLHLMAPLTVSPRTPTHASGVHAPPLRGPPASPL